MNTPQAVRNELTCYLQQKFLVWVICEIVCIACSTLLTSCCSATQLTLRHYSNSYLHQQLQHILLVIVAQGKVIPYYWHTKLMPISTFAHGYILPYQSGFAHGKINTNQQFFKGSHLTSLYIMSSLLIQGIRKLDTLFAIMDFCQYFQLISF